MSKLDDMIREALEGEDQKIIEETNELGWLSLGLNQYRGKLAWVTWVITVVQVSMFAACVWCAIKFYNASDMVIALKYGLTSAYLGLSALQIKLSLMPAMQADRIIRELKRVELMIASRTA